MHPKKFWIPTKPYTAEEAIQRMRSATGTMAQAMMSTHNSYNGHSLDLNWIPFRSHYVGFYTWGGPVILVRSPDLQEAIDVMLDEFDRQGKGSCLKVCPRPEDMGIAEKNPRLQLFSPEIETIYNATWKTWQHHVVNEALSWERNFGVPAQLMLESSNLEDWIERRDRSLREQNPNS